MRSIVLVGAVVFSASTCLAQTDAPPQPATPGTAAQSQADAPAQRSGPANICQELLAFMTTPVPEAEAPAPAKPAAAASEQAKPAAESGENGNATSALAGTTEAGKAASPEADSETNSAQEITGQDGVATDAPEPGEAVDTASGSVKNAPQKESRAAPLPPADVASTPRESVLTVEAAKQLAAANDLEQCQKTAREMRVAGVSMPPPLMALAALDLQYQQESTGENVPATADGPEAND